MSESDPSRVRFLAFILDDISKCCLLDWVRDLGIETGGDGWTTHADHVTFVYTPSQSQLNQFPWGVECEMQVVGVAADAQARAVQVDVPDWLPRPSAAVPHVTVSCAPGVRPLVSDNMLAQAMGSGAYMSTAEIMPLTLRGRLGGVTITDSHVFAQPGVMDGSTTAAVAAVVAAVVAADEAKDVRDTEARREEATRVAVQNADARIASEALAEELLGEVRLASRFAGLIDADEVLEEHERELEHLELVRQQTLVRQQERDRKALGRGGGRGGGCGGKGSGRTCAYFNSPRGCYRGETCGFEHGLASGPDTRDKVKRPVQNAERPFRRQTTSYENADPADRGRLQPVECRTADTNGLNTHTKNGHHDQHQHRVHDDTPFPEDDVDDATTLRLLADLEQDLFENPVASNELEHEDDAAALELLRDMGFDDNIVSVSHVIISAESRTALQSMLPSESQSTIDAALRKCGGDVNAAATFLFEEQERDELRSANRAGDRSWYQAAESWAGVSVLDRPRGGETSRWELAGRQRDTDGDGIFDPNDQVGDENSNSNGERGALRPNDLDSGAGLPGGFRGRDSSSSGHDDVDVLDADLDILRDKQRKMSVTGKHLELQTLHGEAAALYMKFRRLKKLADVSFAAGDHRSSREHIQQSKDALNMSYGKQAKAGTASTAAFNQSTRGTNTKKDLHGLTVEQAVRELRKTLIGVAGTDSSGIQVITGRGVHSEMGRAKLGPAVREYLRSQNIKYNDEVDGGSLTIAFV